MKIYLNSSLRGKKAEFNRMAVGDLVEVVIELLLVKI